MLFEGRIGRIWQVAAHQVEAQSHMHDNGSMTIER